MPKINGKPVDPKAYALRITNAKKIIAKADPAVKRKIAEMYPKFSKEGITKKTLDRQMKKKATPVPMPKITSGRRTAKPMPAAGAKKKPSITATPKAQTPKKKTLDDFLLKGKRPPRAPGQKKLPSDSDVILKKYKGK